MNGQQNNQLITIDNKRIDTKDHYNSPHTIDRTGYQESIADDEINLKELFFVVLKRKKTIFFTIFLSVLIAYIYTSSLTPVYRATASIKIDVKGDRLAGDYGKVYEDKDIDRNSNFTTQQDLLKSRVLAKRVIEKLELDDDILNEKKVKPFYSVYLEQAEVFFTQKIIQPILGNVSIIEPFPSNDDTNDLQTKIGERPIELTFLDNLSLTPSKQSNVLQINYDSHDPELAAASVNTLAEEFILMKRLDSSESGSFAKEYLKKQLVLAKDRLQTSEAAAVRYAKEKNIISTGEGKGLISGALEALNEAYTEAQKDLITAESEYRQRKNVSGGILMMNNPVIQTLKEQKGKLEAEYKQKLKIYKPAFPEMVQLREEINTFEQQLKLESKNIEENSKNDLETKYLAAKQNVEMLSIRLENKKDELLGQRDKSIGYSTLQREVQTNRELYDSLLQRKTEVEIAEGVVSNNISIIDTAFVPYVKHSPNRTLNMLVGTMLGLILGVAIAFVRESFDSRIHSTDDLEDLVDLPVLGIFPFVKNKNKNKKRRNRSDAILLTDRPQSIEYEAFCSLITNLGYIGVEGLPKIIHLTSSGSAEGKSNVALNMASILAESNLKVLLVDADLRKPRIDSYLGVEAKNGLAEYLLDRCQVEDAIIDHPIENMFIMTAGMPAPSPVKLLAADRMIELLEYAKEEYDHIIIDSPPVLGLADALILSNRADITLFIAASNETKSPHLLDALKRLRLGYGNVVGFVLTKVKSSKSDYYGHNSYYGYQRDEVLRLGKTG